MKISLYIYSLENIEYLVPVYYYDIHRFRKKDRTVNMGISTVNLVTLHNNESNYK